MANDSPAAARADLSLVPLDDLLAELPKRCTAIVLAMHTASSEDVDGPPSGDCAHQVLMVGCVFERAGLVDLLQLGVRRKLIDNMPPDRESES